MADKKEESRKTGTGEETDLNVKDLLLDQAFLTRWERSLAEGSNKDEEDSPKPGPEEREDLDVADLVLDGTVLSGLGGSFGDGPEETEPEEAAPEADARDYLNIADLVLDGSALSGLEGSITGEPGEPASRDAGPDSGDEGYLDLKELALDEDFLGRWESSLAGKPPGKADPAHDADAPRPKSATEAGPMLDGAEGEAQAPEGDVKKGLIAVPFLGKGSLTLPARWLYVGLLAAGLAGLLIMGIPLFRAKPQLVEDPVKTLEQSRREVVVKGLYLPLEKGERGLYLSVNLLLDLRAGAAVETGDAVWLREAAFDAAHTLKIDELRGYVGMKALKRRILEIARSRHPGLKVADIHFFEYLII